MIKVIKDKGKSYKGNNRYKRYNSAPLKSNSLINGLDSKLSSLSGDIQDFNDEEFDDVQAYASEVIGKKKIIGSSYTTLKKENPKNEKILHFYDDVLDCKNYAIDLTNVGQVKASKAELETKLEHLNRKCAMLKTTLSYRPLDDPLWKEYERFCNKKESYKNIIDTLKEYEKPQNENSLAGKQQEPQEDGQESEF